MLLLLLLLLLPQPLLLIILILFTLLFPKLLQSTVSLIESTIKFQSVLKNVLSKVPALLLVHTEIPVACVLSLTLQVLLVIVLHPNVVVLMLPTSESWLSVLALLLVFGIHTGLFQQVSQVLWTPLLPQLVISIVGKSMCSCLLSMSKIV